MLGKILSIGSDRTKNLKTNFTVDLKILNVNIQYQGIGKPERLSGNLSAKEKSLLCLLRSGDFVIQRQKYFILFS